MRQKMSQMIRLEGRWKSVIEYSIKEFTKAEVGVANKQSSSNGHDEANDTCCGIKSSNEKYNDRSVSYACVMC